MSYKILICGLPGAGKTWLAERLVKELDDCAWFNADKIREAANDWDFSPEGRTRQAQRMYALCDFENWNGRNALADFVAPTESTRADFEADVTIWMDTIKEGRYEDTNKMFEPVKDADFVVTHHMSDEEIKDFSKRVIEYAENKPTVEAYLDDDEWAAPFGDSASVPNFIRK